MISKETTFLIYDYETFGKDPALDRPAQFASIRVDSQFEKRGDSEIFFCKPPDDYLPDPESVCITGITPQKALLDGLKESEFSQRIQKIFFSEQDTCILGYNNLRFDDQYSYNIFYRNFYDPYGWSWKQGNSRWDLLDVMRAFYAFYPDGIQWPLNDNGFPSFRLQDLTIANGIQHVNAHDAEEDVYATLAMAKLVRQKNPKLFDYLYRYRDKRLLRQLINIEDMKPLVHISGMFGAARGNTALVMPLAWHPTYSNAVIVCDLSGDMQVLQDLDSIDLHKRLYTCHDDLGDASPVPLKLVHLNKCPVLASIDQLSFRNEERLGINRQRCLDNLELLRRQSNLQEKVTAVFAEPYVSSKDVDVESRLYDGFFENEDRMKMDVVLATTDPKELSALDIKFTDPRLEPLFFRYRARNFPDTLDNQEKQRWLEHRKMRFTRLYIEEYMRKLDSLYLEHKGDQKKTQLIHALSDYLQKVVPSEILSSINFQKKDLSS
ncbi:exodeoxyribonuclease I [Candidatus Liberibacter sp.]|uniref:exodeoxyribonuclease I n=1 Tax=Candidatus Liberibacter sp. TaxID=34022 RepID=UPI0015F7298C|nr:exodeoxyribonuclease I [Candidatus Liberibacter sp.]MBA5723643.1 exodeoxyribonuclease I [Candidatus Liberibacter sp.]